MFLLVAGKTDPGKCRANNEDSFSLVRDLSLFLVADGMGGHAAGEVASRMAVDVITDHQRRGLSGREPLQGRYREDFANGTNRLASGIRVANHAIFQASLDNPAWHGMGTTLAAVCCTGDRAGIAHVGDSRVYLIRQGEIRQLTEDHSLVSEQVREGLLTPEEAARSTLQNVVTRALGQKEMVEVSLQEIDLRSGDRLLVCSDGLSEMVPDGALLAVAGGTKSPSLACRRLVDLANQLGGKDNITVVIIDSVGNRLVYWFKRLMEGFRRG